MAVEVPLIPCLLVLFRGPSPSDEALREAVREWIEERVPAPERDALLARADEVVFDEPPAARVLPALRESLAPAMCQGVEERAAFYRAERVVSVHVHTGAAGSSAAMTLELAAARAVATRWDGIVLDPASQRLHPLDSRYEPPVPVRVEDVVQVFSAEADGQIWATSLGLPRFGLPELEIADVPPHLLPHLAPLVKPLAAEVVARAPRWGVPPGGVTVGGVRFGITAESEPFDVLVVHPPGDPEGDVGPLLAQLALSLGAGDASEVVQIAPDDAVVQAAIAAARAQLSEVRRRFREGLPPLARLFLRVRFGAGQGSESMWVVVDKFTRHLVRGWLVDHPQVVALRCGQRVRVAVDDVLDWRIQHPDGSTEGGRVDEVLRQRQVEPVEVGE